MRAVAAHDYCRAMRVRSPRWDTVHLPHSTFRQLVRPFRDFLSVEPAAAAMQASG
jgi:hypothetical protein